MRRITALLVLLLVLVSAAANAADDITVTKLRCEYRTNPMGIDVARPRLGWIVKSEERGQRQTAYQVLVASSRKKLQNNKADLWDSGKVTSEKSAQVTYKGRTLRSRVRCWWKVRVWDKDGDASAYSDPAWWEMGLLDKDDWEAEWLSAPKSQDPSVKPDPAPLFRKAFTLDKPVEKARAYVTGLGYYELHLNGDRVGDHVLDPAFTRYDRRALYVTYDLTDHLQRGKNAAGMILGNGWYNMHSKAVWDFDKAPWRDRPTMICQIEVTYQDGSTKIITSDSSWKVSTGPIRFDSIREGETYDARMERPGWSTPDYGDSGWKKAAVVDGPGGRLTAQKMPPMRVTRTLKPVKITEPKDGHYVFDMGQNTAGWVRLKVNGPRGTEVVMRYGERLHEDGTLDQKSIARFCKKGEFQTDRYILHGDGVETWEPRFVYHGFRYVEVTGFPGEPTKDSLTACVVHTDFDRAGSFRCSKELFNRIQHNTRWSYMGNYHGYPTDCPHREKNGWTGDAHLAAEQAMYNWHNAAAYEKWMRDFKDEQRPDGVLPGIVPTSGWGYEWGNGPAWDSAYFLIPWYLYQYRRDTRLMEVHYENWKRYVDYLSSVAKDHIVDIGLGDWVPADTETPVAVTSTGYYYVDTRILARAAEMLGKEEDAEKYSELAEKIRESFNEHFYKGNGVYANGSQTALSCAIYQGFARGERKAKAVQQLVKNIEEHDGHIDTGILGAKYLFHALTRNGEADVAYRVATRTTYPSYGHWIERGATTLWESWDGKQGGSLNHIMFGDISAWFYQTLGGIRVDPDKPGFKHIIFRPYPLGDLKWVEAEHESIYGTVKSSWKKSGDSFRLEVTVPVNCTATVSVPLEGENSSVHLPDEQGIERAGRRGQRMLYQTGSGTYVFVTER